MVKKGKMTMTPKKEIELLAPAGSYETFQAVIQAGADAVYLGGNRFGARAYANNFSEEELLAAIDFAHMHDRQVYLTVNTLLKEDELNRDFYKYLLPYYRHGLDAVIVQDLGAVAIIRESFPDLDIHTSTQMTITGRDGAAYMKKLGATRIVTAREMSLEEIKDIHEHVDIEIESFVHGALCYCYSGQCLLSSMLGGRSGNRGRCAQPCRLPYEVYDRQKKKIKDAGSYVLSPKDLCAISYIPQLSENGIYSFKIEGRMKQAGYAAGVVSVYRKYIDKYLNELNKQRQIYVDEHDARIAAANTYQVSRADTKKLLDFGNRSGFTDGYYFRHNGKEMITFQKPGYEKTNNVPWNEITADSELKQKIDGILTLQKDVPAVLELKCKDIIAKTEGMPVQQAKKQPLSVEKTESCIRQTGSTPFVFDTLKIQMEEGSFLPVQALKQLRRDALQKLEQLLLANYRRNATDIFDNKSTYTKSGYQYNDEKSFAVQKSDYKYISEKTSANTNLAVSVENRNQLGAVLSCAAVNDIYLDSICYNRESIFKKLAEDIAAIHGHHKHAYYSFPTVFRKKTVQFYRRHAQDFLNLSLDGVIVKSYDAVWFVREIFGNNITVIFDHNLYTYNQKAKELLTDFKPLRDTAPLELNKRELSKRDNRNSEIYVYGYLPLMASAQCVHANTGQCDRKPDIYYLKDRCGKYFPVKNHCAECYNTIYNTVPLALFHVMDDLKCMGFYFYRISFTIESEEEIRRVLTYYQEQKNLPNNSTNGHYKRGVE